MTTFQVAFEALIAVHEALRAGALPSIVRFGSLIASRQACGDRVARATGSSAANALRVRCGAVGARSGAPVAGLSQTPFAEALALRNERSSRKKISRFLPQRKLR